jgi:hypothetical protein
MSCGTSVRLAVPNHGAVDSEKSCNKKTLWGIYTVRHILSDFVVRHEFVVQKNRIDPIYCAVWHLENMSDRVNRPLGTQKPLTFSSRPRRTASSESTASIRASSRLTCTPTSAGSRRVDFKKVCLGWGANTGSFDYVYFLIPSLNRWSTAAPPGDSTLTAPPRILKSKVLSRGNRDYSLMAVWSLHKCGWPAHNRGDI